MTEEQYRNSPLRQALAEFLSTPAGINLVVMLKDGAYIVDPEAGAPEIASVRVLSQAAGFNECLKTMLRMSEPSPRAEEPIQETWEEERLGTPAPEPGTM